MSNHLTLNVVIGILINSQNQVFLAQRPSHASHAGLWEFPGGKVEKNEENYVALCRELNEETGIEVVSAKSIMTYSYQYPEYGVNLSVWLVAEFMNEPLGKEGQLVRWVNIEDLSNYQFPQANQNILRYLLDLRAKNLVELTYAGQ